MRIAKFFIFYYVYVAKLTFCIDDIFDDIDISTIELLCKLDPNLQDCKNDLEDSKQKEKKKDQCNIQIDKNDFEVSNSEIGGKKNHLQNQCLCFLNHGGSHQNKNFNSNTAVFDNHTHFKNDKKSFTVLPSERNYQQSDFLFKSAVEDYGIEKKCLIKERFYESSSDTKDHISKMAQIALIEKDLIDSSQIFMTEAINDKSKNEPVFKYSKNYEKNLQWVELIDNGNNCNTQTMTQTHITSLNNSDDKNHEYFIGECQNASLIPYSLTHVCDRDKVIVQDQQKNSYFNLKNQECQHDMLEQNPVIAHVDLDKVNGHFLCKSIEKESKTYVKNLNDCKIGESEKQKNIICSLNHRVLDYIEGQTHNFNNNHNYTQTNSQFSKPNTKKHLEKLEQQKKQNICKRAYEIAQPNEKDLEEAKKCRIIQVKTSSNAKSGTNLAKIKYSSEILDTIKQVDLKIVIKIETFNAGSSSNCTKNNENIYNIVDKKAKTPLNSEFTIEKLNPELNHYDLQSAENTISGNPMLNHFEKICSEDNVKKFKELEDVINYIHNFRFAFIQLNSLKYVLNQKKDDICANLGILKSLKLILSNLKHDLFQFKKFYDQLYTECMKIENAEIMNKNRFSIIRLHYLCYYCQYYKSSVEFFENFCRTYKDVQINIYKSFECINQISNPKIITDDAWELYSFIFKTYIEPSFIYFNPNQINIATGSTSSSKNIFSIKFSLESQIHQKDKTNFVFVKSNSHYPCSIQPILFDSRSHSIIFLYKKLSINGSYVIKKNDHDSICRNQYKEKKKTRDMFMLLRASFLDAGVNQFLNEQFYNNTMNNY